MRPFALISAIMIGFLSVNSLANTPSPAQDLYDQATFLLEFNYNGFSKIDLQELVKKYQVDLDNACVEKKNACDYDTARPIIDKMAEEINDGHTNYWTPQALSDQKRSSSGAVNDRPRIGISTQQIDGSNERLILEVVENSPGEKAGLLRGDRISAVNGQPLPTDRQANTTFINQAVAKNPTVVLSIIRGQNKLEITVTAAIFSASRSPSLQTPDFLPKEVAILRIPDFYMTGKIGSTVHQLLINAQQKGIRDIIVDLRNNIGGRPDECLISAGAFVKMPVVLHSKKLDFTKEYFRNGVVYNKISDQPEFFTQKLDKSILWDGKVVVLANKNTASCGEGMADLIQNGKAGPVIGEKTAGVLNTGTIIYDLIDGGGMQVSTMKILRGDGVPRPEFVTPDIEVKDDLDELAKSGRDLPLEKALEVLGYKK